MSTKPVFYKVHCCACNYFAVAMALKGFISNHKAEHSLAITHLPRRNIEA
uniref:Uncharacterized protein n=1 Tax=Anguilla anguilla TaxID=7936 RepID=A0A0E9WHN5_ANGAN